MKTIKMFVLAALFLFTGEWITAQPRGQYPPVRDRVSNVRLNQIGKRMGLEKERVEQLRPVYLKFEHEKHETMDGKLIRQMRMSPDSLTNEQAEQLFFVQMEKAKRMIELREKYFKEFQKVLSPKEILRFHRIEKNVNKKMMQQFKDRYKNFKK